MREATVICRLSSKNGAAYYQRLHEELPKRGIAIVEAHMVAHRKELQKRIRQAVKAERKLIVVIGGDGSQTAAVAELAHCRSVLAVVPAGTGNSFALSLGIENNIDTAIETIVSGKKLRVDIGMVNGTYFANFATIGLIAEAANQTPKPLKRIIGPLAYGIGAIVPVLRHKPFTLRVKWPGHDLSVVTHQAILASGRFYGWQPLTPGANVRSGELAFFVSEGASASDVVKTNAALLRGDQTEMQGAHYFAADKVTVKTKPRQPINIDGHALGKTPATFRVVCKALRVLVPSDFKASE